MKGKIKLIIACSISVVGILGTLTVFKSDIILPKFPYKISLIDTKIKNANVNNESIKNYLAINKEQTLIEIKEKAEQAQQIASDLEQQYKSIKEPTGVDYGSALIFIEEKTIKSNLQVLDIKFEDQNTALQQEQQEQQQPQEQPQQQQEDKENDTEKDNPKERLTDNDMSLGQVGEYSSSIIKVKVLGPYANIQNYLETLPKELGDFNYINNFQMWKTSDSLAKEGANINNSYLLEDEKNMIVEFEIVLYNKN